MCSTVPYPAFFAPALIGDSHVMGWGSKAIEIRAVDNGQLDGVFMHKRTQKLRFLCERNDKVLGYTSACELSYIHIYKCTVVASSVVCCGYQRQRSER